jgi:hypothetical protein
LGRFAGGYAAVEVCGFFLWDAECLPVFAGEMLGEKHNLPDVMGIVSYLAIDGLHHGVRLGADGDGAGQILIREGIECIEANLPAGFPESNQTRACLGRSIKFGIAVAIRFFAVRGEKIGPAGTHVAGHVLDDDGDGIGFGVQGGEEMGVGALFDGAIAKPFVITEEIAGVFGVGGCELVCHGTILSRREAQFNGE